MAIAGPASAQAMVASPGAYSHSIPAAGVSDAAQRTSDEATGATDPRHAALLGTSYQPSWPQPGYGAHMTPLTLSSVSEIPSSAPKAPVAVVHRVPDDGFDWSSALIGSGAAGLLALTLGGAVAATPKRRPARQV